MMIKKKDLGDLAYAVHNFLGKADLLTRLSTRTRLVMNFSDVGTMKHMEIAVMRALSTMSGAASHAVVHQTAEGTIEIEIMTMTLVLTCNQLFMTQSGKVVGYNSIDFRDPEGDAL
jgi:hypothetical protein